MSPRGASGWWACGSAWRWPAASSTSSAASQARWSARRCPSPPRTTEASLRSRTRRTTDAGAARRADPCPQMPSSRHVIVAGGGFAALEALLALRALAEERVTLELIASDPLLRYRPSATGAPFGADEVAAFELAELAARAGATFRGDAVIGVMASQRAIRLASGVTRAYDSLVLALGARRRAAIPGALTFRDQRDVHHVARVLDELRDGRVHTVAFAAPLGVAWTLPPYEL